MIVDAGMFELQAAFASKLATFDPDIARSKVGNNPYIQAWLIPAGEDVSGLGQHAPTEAVGFYQVDAVCPIDIGDGVLWQMADAITRHFKVGSNIEYEDFVALVTRTTRSGIIAADPGWQKVSVRAFYLAHFRR